MPVAVLKRRAIDRHGPDDYVARTCRSRSVPPHPKSRRRQQPQPECRRSASRRNGTEERRRLGAWTGQGLGRRCWLLRSLSVARHSTAAPGADRPRVTLDGYRWNFSGRLTSGLALSAEAAWSESAVKPLRDSRPLCRFRKSAASSESEVTPLS